MPTTYHDFLDKHMDDFNLKILGKNHETWAQFRALESDAERYKMALSLLPAYDVKIEADPNGKSDQTSLEARTRGNAYFTQNDFGRALLTYNEAIRHAPCVSTDEASRSGSSDGESGVASSLALAYGNRSAVFFRMERYAECVADVDRAAQLGYPEDTLIKLVARKVRSLIRAKCFNAALKCAKEDLAPLVDAGARSEYDELLSQVEKGQGELMKKGKCQQDPELVPLRLTAANMETKAAKWQLKNGPHETFPALSSSLELSVDENGGTRLLAGEDIMPGDVLAVEGSFVNAVFQDLANVNCCNCTMWTDVPLPCQGCAKVVFCSEECSKSETAMLHEKECFFLWMLDCSIAKPESQAHAVSVLRALLKKSPEEWRLFAEKYPPGPPSNGIHSTKQYYDFLHMGDFLTECEFLPTAMGFLASAYIVKLLEKSPGFGEQLAAVEDPSSLKTFLGGLAMRLYANIATKGDFCSQYLSPTCVYEIAYRQTGVAMRPTLALFGKRACYANVTEAAFGDAVVIRASYPIKKGEPIVRLLGCHFFFEQPMDHRQDAIDSPMHDPNCKACVEHWPPGSAHLDAGDRISFKCLRCSHPFVACMQSGSTWCCPKCLWDGVGAMFKHEAFWSKREACHYPSSLLFEIMADVSQYLQPTEFMLHSFALKLMTCWGLEGNKNYTRELIEVKTEFLPY